jgi:cysteine desulfuration protein SufE
MNRIKKRIKEWSENLSLLEGQDRLVYLIDLAKNKTTMDFEKRIKERLVTGCISQIWVDVMVEDNKVNVEYDSDAMITKGITSIVCDCFNDSTIEECKEINGDDFLELGIVELLSQQRRNGLGNLIATIISRFDQLVKNQREQI